MKSIETRATHHAATCFLNSLFREWNGFKREGDAITVALTEGETLRIFVEKFSTVGRHRYSGEFWLEKPATRELISFAALVRKVSAKLARDLKTPSSVVQTFIDRVSSSERTLLLSLQNLASSSSALPQSRSPKIDFESAEQGLLIGHNFHPTPKSRDEFSEDEMRRYSPEFKSRFALTWLCVHRDVLHQNHARSFEQINWTTELAQIKGVPLKDLQGGMIAVPMHPWQWQVLLKNPYIQALLQREQIIVLGESSELWSATSSLRSLYREGAPFMLKFSMSLKLTNSIRHLLAPEVERGLQLHDVLETKKGREFLRKFPHFHVVTEPAYLAIKGEDGRPLSETIVVCRQNPFRGEEANHKAVLATLVQDSPLGTQNLIHDFIRTAPDDLSLRERSRKWFRDYLRVTVEPLVTAQAEYGVILGAHQQNLVLEINKGYPSAAYFRDCQGTGYSELGYRNFAHDVELINRENGNVVSERMANSLFIYYLILNSTFNVITSIAQDESDVSEAELLKILRSHLVEQRAALLASALPHDLSCLNALLEGDQLMHKGNFLCAFECLNENTTVDPLAIYTPVTNSLNQGLYA